MSSNKSANENNGKRSGRISLTSTVFKVKMLLIIAVVVTLYILAVIATDSNPIRVIEGFEHIWNFVKDDLFPPNLDYFTRVWEPLLETWNIAIFGTTFGALLALPVSFLAAGNITTNKYLYRIFRFIFNIIRTVPEVILAVLFVALVGIGDVSGILALTVLTVGIIGKLLSESIESIDPGPIEAIQASGGNKLQVIRYAVLPQVLPQYVSYTLYSLEINVKASVILGFVGAGGIGIILRQQLAMFNYDRVATIILTIFIVVTIIDFISNRVRERLE